MAEPGWYPDPAGRERHFRYWDGSRWGTSTTRAPAAPDPKRPNFLLVATLVVAAVAALSLLTWNAVGGPTRTTAGQAASPTPIPRQDDGPIRPSATTSPAPPTPTPPGPTAGATNAPCPDPGPSVLDPAPAGQLSSAGLSLVLPQGWEPSGYELHSGLSHHSTAARPHAGTGWLSFMSLGLAAYEAGNTDPALTARQLAQCHVTGSLFSGLTGLEISLDEAVTVDGAAGWRVRLKAASTRAPGGGATYDVVVLETGRADGFSVFWSGMVDADQAGLAGVEAAIAAIEVGG